MTKEEFQAAVFSFLGDTPVYIETGRDSCWGHSHSIGYYAMSAEADKRCGFLANELGLSPDLICRYALGKSAPYHLMFPHIIKGIEKVKNAVV
jgi:hypothetical protein